MNPEVIKLLNDLRTLVGEQYVHLNFAITIDQFGITYSQNLGDQDGNMLSMSERKVFKAAS